MNFSGHSQEVRQEPRFGLNALMRYMVASPIQRHRIIRDQKFPPTFKVIWYEAACEATTRFVAGGTNDQSILTGEMSRLAASTPSNESDAVKKATNIEALECFLNSYDQIQLYELTPYPGDGNPPLITISGLQISVRPEIVLRGEVRGRAVAGALKLYFSKGDPLTEEAAQYGAVVMFAYCQDHLSSGATVRPQFCSVFDIFSGRHCVAPTALTQRMRNIEAACTEIVTRWPTITA